MSRRKKRSRKKTTAESPASSTTTEAPAVSQISEQAATTATQRFRLTAIVFGLWAIGLVLLVVFTANPVTLNRRQIRNARVVISGEVVDLKSGRVKVVKNWNATETPTEIEIEGLDETVRVAGWWSGEVRTGETYLFPLSGASNRRLHVTSVSSGEGVALIYPANENTERQLRDLFPAE